MVPHLPALFATAIMDEVTKPREITGLVGGSSFGPRADMCLKKLQFLTLRTPMNRTNPPLNLAFTLFRGTVLDELVKKLSAKLELPLEPDVYGKDEENLLGGTLDFILHLPEEDGGLTVVELKSISPDQYRYMRGPLPKHLYQVALYMHTTGARQAILYYVPHQDDVAADPISLLKKAVRGSSGELQADIEAVVNKYSHLTALVPEVKELGRQYLVKYDQKVVDEILGAMAEVKEANDAGVWLGKQVKQCGLCPHTVPCYANATVAECDKRQEVVTP